MAIAPPLTIASKHNPVAKNDGVIDWEDDRIYWNTELKRKYRKFNDCLRRSPYRPR